MAQHEFLPLCDVLFNIISLAAYFCDIVFDVLMGYAFYVHGKIEWFATTIFFVLLSSVIQQVISIRWYIHIIKAKILKEDKNSNFNLITVVKQLNVAIVSVLHLIQLGVFWRYFKLFIPVDLRYVKYEVRDLCILRLVHAFCESMPLLLVQLYLYWNRQTLEYSDLNVISMSLSLFSVCWALASFSKNVRMHNVHRLVLTWLGVIIQFFWRVGTVGARAISLVAYATLFKSWIFLVILLHWFSMFLWILSPKNIFHGQRVSFYRKALFYTVIAFVYTFAYINLMEINHREKMLMFYVVMGLENTMLMFLWFIMSIDKPPYLTTLPLVVLLLFCGGIGFMWLYYRYFHVRRLKYEAGGRFNNSNSNIGTIDTNILTRFPTSNSINFKYENPLNDEKELIRRHSFSGGYTNLSELTLYSRIKNESSVSGEESRLYHKSRSHNQPVNSNVAIPGVFNCRFSNPYVAAMQKRKRKKPTSFVPPPSISQNDHTNLNGNLVQTNGSLLNNNIGYNAVPFWCRPLPNQYHQQNCCENEYSSVGYRPDIQEKLFEKKRKQIAELKKIEEEIKLGKLRLRPNEPCFIKSSNIIAPPCDKKAPHYETPELLLTPKFLNHTQPENYYYDWTASVNCEPVSRTMNDESLKLMYKTYRTPSDLDSQLSLPRSFTLPREFKYYRRIRSRKLIRTEHFMPSTNSSDGDVDSCDDSDSLSSQMTSQPQPLKLPTNTMQHVRHETQL